MILDLFRQRVENGVLVRVALGERFGRARAGNAGQRRRSAVYRFLGAGQLGERGGGGFAVGALLSGGIADLWGLRAAVWTIAALTAASGLLVAARMYETHRPPSP